MKGNGCWTAVGRLAEGARSLTVTGVAGVQIRAKGLGGTRHSTGRRRAYGVKVYLLCECMLARSRNSLSDACEHERVKMQ